MNTDFKFRKAERIVSQKTIDDLFSGTGSQSLVAFPIRVVYKYNDTPLLVGHKSQILLSVSKRHFKHAVDRNRCKRQLREAYRRHKTLLTDRLPSDRQVVAAFIWMADSLFPSEVIERQMCSLLKRMADKL